MRSRMKNILANEDIGLLLKEKETKMNRYADVEALLADNKCAVMRTAFDMDAGGNAANLEQEVLPLDLGENADAEHLFMRASGRPVYHPDGEKHVFLEPFFPEERLIVLGGGHVGCCLVEIAARCGFTTVAVDDRADFANEDRFPWAYQIVCDDFIHAIRELKIREQDLVCIMTRGHSHDADCLLEVLSGTEPAYVGMLGSKKKINFVREKMIEKGIPAERLDRVSSPIGLDIGGVTPEEITISILAELISVKRKGRGNQAAGMRTDLDPEVIRLIAEEPLTPKAVATIMRTEGSVPRGAGAKMVIYEDGKIAGSIGGGAKEAMIIAEAKKIIGTGKTIVRHIDLNGKTGGQSASVCGGILDVLVQDV